MFIYQKKKKKTRKVFSIDVVQLHRYFVAFLFLSPFIIIIIFPSICFLPLVRSLVLFRLNRLSFGGRFRVRNWSILWSSNSFLLSRHRLWRAQPIVVVVQHIYYYYYLSVLFIFIFYFLLSYRINVVCASRVNPLAFAALRCSRRVMVVGGETDTDTQSANSSR